MPFHGKSRKSPDIDQVAISKALGSTIVPAPTVRFGRMGLIPLVAAARKPTDPDAENTESPTQEDNE